MTSDPCDALLAEAGEVFSSILWRSTNKDNMEFSATIPYSLMVKMHSLMEKLHARLRAQIEGGGK